MRCCSRRLLLRDGRYLVSGIWYLIAPALPCPAGADVFRASGAGGQHVNTTESAVRVTHIPTGLQASIQDERSQIQNKNKALALVAARVYEARRSADAEQRSAERRSLIGSGDRSERIRTYNYMQSRVTDHRIGLTIHGLEDMLAGAQTFTTITDALAEQHTVRTQLFRIPAL